MTEQKDIPSKSSVTPYEATQLGGGGGGGGDVVFKIDDDYGGGATHAFKITIGEDETDFTIKTWEGQQMGVSDIMKVMSDAGVGDQVGMESFTFTGGAELTGVFGMCTYRDAGSGTEIHYDATFVCSGLFKPAGETSYHPLIYIKALFTSGNVFTVAYWNGTATATATISADDVASASGAVFHRYV